MEAYKGKKGTWENSDFYQLGFAYYKNENYNKAIGQFNKIIGKKNSLAQNAYYYLEGSPDPGGLPYRYLLKGSILVAFTLLILQGVAELLRNYLILTKQDPS